MRSVSRNRLCLSVCGVCLVCMPVGQCLPTRHGKGKMILPNNTSCVYPVGRKLGGEKVVREKFRWGKKGDFGPFTFFPSPFFPYRDLCPLRSRWGHFWVVWGHFGVLFVSFWGRLGPLSQRFVGHFGVICWHVWCHFGTF